jgi:acetolactate decarboxylase
MKEIAMRENKMYQVSTLQALALGYSRAVVSVEELLRKGDCGLGTFEGVDGEMIVLDGCCYRADQDGRVSVVAPETGIPFAAVGRLYGEQRFELGEMPDIESVRSELTERIEGHFGLNSMHVVRIDGEFEMVDARSESPYMSHHVTLKEILGKNQKAFLFENIRGSLVGVYFPDYMDGINMPGWHLHFLSEDRTKGGHVFDVSVRTGTARVDKITSMELDLPKEAAFDTYALKQDLRDEIKSVE